MTHQISSRATPDGVPSQDDWKNMKRLMKKKRAQNRVTQQNYRRNVKRRIEELEQQVATQVRLLAPEQETTIRSCTPGVSSLAARDVPSSIGGTLGPSTQDRLRDSSVTLPTPASLLFGAPEDSSTSDNLLDALWYRHIQGDTNQHGESFLLNQETQRYPPCPQSPAQSNDLDIGMLDDAPVRSPMDHFPLFGDPGHSRKTARQRRDFVRRGGTSSVSMSQKALLPDGDATTFEQTIEGRVEYVIKCARRAGFRDLDSAVTTLYTAEFDDDSECSIAQCFSRKRCLPSLLEELRSKTVSGKTREVQPYQDEVLKSAESLLIGEMRPQRPAAVRGWSASSRQLQDKLNRYMLITMMNYDD